MNGSKQSHVARAAVISALGLLVLVALEFTDIDRSLARLSFDPAAHGFPLQNNAVLAWLHKAVKLVAACAVVWILVGLWRPLGLLQRLDRRERLYLLVATIACLVVVSSLKRASALDCPWALSEFGGHAPYLRLLDPVPKDWIGGGCLPAGHVLLAFAFIGGYFAFVLREPVLARRWLFAVLVIGALAGTAQQVRGAHFLTHTLWSLWWCWTLSAVLAWIFRTRLRPINDERALAQ